MGWRLLNSTSLHPVEVEAVPIAPWDRAGTPSAAQLPALQLSFETGSFSFPVVYKQLAEQRQMRQVLPKAGCSNSTAAWGMGKTQTRRPPQQRFVGWAVCCWMGTAPAQPPQDGMGWDGTGQDGTGWDETGWDGMG